MRGQVPKVATCQKASRKTCDCQEEWLGGRCFCSAELTGGRTQERGYGLPADLTQWDAVVAKVRSRQVWELLVSASAGRFLALRVQRRVPAELTQSSV